MCLWPEQRWRIDFAFVVLVLWMAPLWIPRVTGKMGIAASVLAGYPFFAAYMFLGGRKGLFLAVMFSIAVLAAIAVLLHVISCLAAGRSLGATIARLLRLENASDRTCGHVRLASMSVCCVVLPGARASPQHPTTF